jgi:molecular chaperone HscB
MQAKKPTVSWSYSQRWASQTTAASHNQGPREPIKKSFAPRTHYEFFPQTLSSGPPPNGPFAIDTRLLRKEFLQLQAIAHPDRHPQSLKQRAEATSARVNEAYKTLQNPLLRAQYLLSLRGIHVADDEAAGVDDPELLMEVLEAWEVIEASSKEEDLDELRRVNDARIEASENVLEEAFKLDDMAMAKGEAVKLRYWINIKDGLNAWEKEKPVVLIH